MPHKDPQKRAEYFSAYRKRHRRHYVDISKRWKESNLSRWHHNQAEYRRKNKELLRLKQAAIYASNPEAKRASMRKYYAENRAEMALRNKQWYLSNVPKVRSRHRKYYLANRERIIEKTTAYLRRNPHIVVLRSANRRARQKCSDLEKCRIKAFILKVRKSKRVVCYYCQSLISGRKAHIEHVLALAAGGLHCVDNLCTACLHCNHRKHAKSVTDLDFITQKFLPL